ncbi:DNA alkylation repair protein [Hoylesella loescheii]|uniref:DNA alkylation repair protein n=1 Tax=Hoylesella loescheii TaxID=840 RepID=UPI0026EC38DF|nr:DNA alkylation repair protein [Hoylesella loescheii]
MINEDTHSKLMAIKQSFRLFMDGTTSRSMAQKGMGYKINWGVPFHELRKMTAPYTPDYELAIELWKENIRECKIMATLIMPPERMSPELADVWTDLPIQQELAEMLAFNLLQHVDFAPTLAYQWMASDRTDRQICAYQLLARLFMRGNEPNERGLDEYFDQVSIALQNENLGVRHAANASLQKLAMLGDNYEQRVDKLLASLQDS